MARINKIRRLAREMDAYLFEEGSAIQAWTPKGYIWCANKAHCIVHEGPDGFADSWNEAYKEMINTMEYGLEKCEEYEKGEECDACDEEEKVGQPLDKWVS